MPASKFRSRRHFLAETAALGAVAAAPWRAVAAPAPAAADDFVADVVREVVKAAPTGNVVVSPVSLQATLALAAVGARGETRDRLLAALGLDKLDPEAIRLRFSSTLLETHRAVFVRGATIDPAYAQTVSDELHADVRQLPAEIPAAVQTINDWADEATHHRIREIVEELDPAMRVTLADAVFLKFEWRRKFKREETRDRPFHRRPGDRIAVPMMSTIATTTAGECRAGTFVQLRFADVAGGVHFVLPATGLSAEEALDIVLRLPQELEPGARWREYHREVHLTLPRLTMRSSSALSNALANAGIGSLFSHADLGGIAPELAEDALGPILQQAWMKVDETGVEAAAVTAMVEVTGVMTPTEPPLVLVFDRPFALLIRDRQTLFAAVVRDPSIAAA